MSTGDWDQGVGRCVVSGGTCFLSFALSFFLSYSRFLSFSLFLVFSFSRFLVFPSACVCVCVGLQGRSRAPSWCWCWCRYGTVLYSMCGLQTDTLCSAVKCRRACGRRHRMCSTGPDKQSDAQPTGPQAEEKRREEKRQEGCLLGEGECLDFYAISLLLRSGPSSALPWPPSTRTVLLGHVLTCGTCAGLTSNTEEVRRESTCYRTLHDTTRHYTTSHYTTPHDTTLLYVDAHDHRALPALACTEGHQCERNETTPKNPNPPTQLNTPPQEPKKNSRTETESAPLLIMEALAALRSGSRSFDDLCLGRSMTVMPVGAGTRPPSRSAQHPWSTTARWDGTVWGGMVRPGTVHTALLSFRIPMRRDPSPA